MAFAKVLKNKAFFKRYQVQKRRRREGKTDYQARRKMCYLDKCKYNAKKHRLVCRLTNSKVIMQVVYPTIVGDMVVCQANSKELTKYGVPCGHKNYAAAYLTGYLIARRTLKLMDMDEDFKGKEECNGEDYHVEDEDEGEKRPFKAIFDVGLTRTTKGARIWGALKGAADGGLHVPHSNKNFIGYTASEDKGGEAEYDAEAHKERIRGNHVKEYMEMLQEEDPTKYEAHFSKYIENDFTADNMEDAYAEAIDKIKEDPTHEPKEKKEITNTRKGNTIAPSEGSEYNRSIKLSLKQRKAKVAAKIAAAQKKLAANDDDE